MALKLSCVGSKCLQKWLSKLLIKRNLTTIPLIPIPEYSQSNATLVTTCHGNATTDGNRKLNFFLGAF